MAPLIFPIQAWESIMKEKFQCEITERKGDHNGRGHGLRTPKESFLARIENFLAWADILGHFSTVSPLSIFSIIQPLFLQKTKLLYPTHIYSFGSGIWIWAANNLKFSLRVSVVRVQTMFVFGNFVHHFVINVLTNDIWIQNIKSIIHISILSSLWILEYFLHFYEGKYFGIKI